MAKVDLIRLAQLELAKTPDPPRSRPIFIQSRKNRQLYNLELHLWKIMGVKSKVYRYVGILPPGTEIHAGQKQKWFVSCSCPRWLYFYEVAMAARGLTKIRYSNGAYPKFTNPGLKPGVCKHLAAVILVLARQNKIRSWWVG